MAKIKPILLLTLAISLCSCGGGTKAKKVRTSSLNRDYDFTIKVPVIAYYEENTNFEFQEGYSMESITEYLDKEKIAYEWKWDMFFMTPIIDEKLEFFFIHEGKSHMDTPLYLFSSASSRFMSYGWVLIPYFLLNGKDDFFKVRQFINSENTGELKLNANGDYSYAKMIYSLTPQKEIKYDEEAKKFTFFNRLEYRFEGDSITFAILPIE